jgi:hypothetical protein
MARGPASDPDEVPPPNAAQRAAENRRARVGAVLRKAYDEALAEPVPEAFADLLRRLD